MHSPSPDRLIFATGFSMGLLMKEEEEEAPSLGSDKTAGEQEVFYRQDDGFGSLIAVISWVSQKNRTRGSLDR